MIFIPCKDGISHNESEDAKPEHITAGCNVRLHAMLERAGVARRSLGGSAIGRGGSARAMADIRSCDSMHSRGRRSPSRNSSWPVLP
jgi:hypothetical protein